VARQTLVARLADGARLEWLPLETIAYRGCRAENQLRFELAPGAQMLGWEMLALGLPAAGEAFSQGHITQHLGCPACGWNMAGWTPATTGCWMPRWAWTASVLGTLWAAAGQALDTALRQALLDAAREEMAADGLAARAGATAPDARVVVCRALARGWNRCSGCGDASGRVGAPCCGSATKRRRASGACEARAGFRAVGPVLRRFGSLALDKP
jgi:urease accessory protein